MPESRKERFRRRINRMRKRHPGRWLTKAWRWAAKKGEYEDNKRWAALQSWAHLHKQYAWKNSHKAEALEKWHREHKSRRRVIHRYHLRAKRWAGRAKHFAHIERLYRQEKRRLRERKREGTLPAPIVYFDGKPCAEWIVRKVLVPARRSGLWRGYLISGYRTPEYSESLCYAMCGAASCPGRCAGRATNHAKHIEPDGAIDVSDSGGLSAWEGRNGYPTRHTLSFDLPHHSRTGQ